MAELTFKSPGVSTREIDLSGPTSVAPQGTPAGIIATANQGPAFVPVTVATYQDFVATFGQSNGEMFGPLAMNEWMRNAKAGTYLRVLGVGDGKKRLTSDSTDAAGANIYAGAVKNAGFIVGQKQVNDKGSLATNPFAYDYGLSGATYMLGCLMSESNGSSIFSDAGLQHKTKAHKNAGSKAIPILRAVVMVASGVTIGLSGNLDGNLNTVVTASTAGSTGIFSASADGGYSWGEIDVQSANHYNFIMLLNGHKSTAQYPNTITASMSPWSPSYFTNVFNTDPTKIQDAGYCMYAHYDIAPTMAVVTGSGIVSTTHWSGSYSAQNTEPAIFAFTSSMGPNAGSTTKPNYENFSDRFRTAKSPWVVSQQYGGQNRDLFKLHCLDDGAYPNTLTKISISNYKKAEKDTDYGTFDLMVRAFGDTDSEPEILESYMGVDLNPGSDNYIARRIGDIHRYFDFDHAAASQKLVVEGTHPNMSKYVRVQMHGELEAGNISPTALPVGYRGPHHLVTSGSSIFNGGYPNHPTVTGSNADSGFHHVKAKNSIIGETAIAAMVEPPIPYRLCISNNKGDKRTANSSYYWGVQFTKQDKLYNNDSNSSRILDPSLASYTKYYPVFATGQRSVSVGDNAGTVDSSGTVLDSDKFNNNLFTLEKVQVHTKSASEDKVDSKEWAFAVYRRNGVLSSSLMKSDGTYTQGRFLNVSKDFGDIASRKYMKFTFFMQGGFDGVNIFNKDKAQLLNAAAMREMDDESQGFSSGPTVATYRKAIDVMSEKSDSDIMLLAIPGIRETNITDHAIDQTEARFDAMYIMDIEERDTLNNKVTGSVEVVGVNNTITDFKSRNLDSSFAAAYFPDTYITDPHTNTIVRCPPSVSVIGAMSLNDKVAFPWYAPAGFTRGALSSTLYSHVKLSRANLDTIYDGDVNPITAFPTSDGVVVFGQKTLLQAASALDRVNVRRLLIDIRRKVRKIADTFLFEPNRADTLARFSASVSPVLTRIQQQQGLDKFKVLIDTTTTTQADVENNTIRGKIFLQPTRSVEFISLDFVVTNNGTEI